MKFQYSAHPQKSPSWFKLRIGKVTASRLDDWLAASKAKSGTGKKLKKRLDYEKELLFERTFGISFDNYVTPAMQDGINFEEFGRKQYEKITGNMVQEVGCWFNDYFVASPDGKIDDVGLLEVKVLKDNSFTSVLTDGVPDKHWKQIQGQLWASGKKWCDYVAVSLNTKKIKIIRVLPDKEFHEWLELAVTEPLTVEKFDSKDLYDFVDEAPEGEYPKMESNFADGDF